MLCVTTRSMLAVLAGAAIATGSPANAGSYRVVYSFGGAGDGAYPDGSLIDVGGVLYGTNTDGGASKQGTVFAVNPATGVEALVHVFQGSDGGNPYAGLIKLGANLYGTTFRGGTCGCGTVFEVNPTTGKEKVVYSFSGGSDGELPYAGLINVGGTLYGSTVTAGAYGHGTLFAVNPATGALAVIHAFAGGDDGAYPAASMIKLGNKLYGTTAAGGSDGYGTVFAVNPATGREKVIHTFLGGSDGELPDASLINVDGTLYGTTAAGGTGGYGTVFAVKLASGAETVVYSFRSGRDGENPYANLTSLGGKLYGTTENGGYGLGTLFEVNPATGKEKVVYSVGGPSDSVEPHAGLINIGGTLYGTSFGGGTSNQGTVFAYTP
jgi:uncharacterized repeat protein (TIGR03803 family)